MRKPPAPAAWPHCLPSVSIPLGGVTHMAHCSFSFLMEPYSACREKSGAVSRRVVLGQGAALGDGGGTLG